VLPTRNRASARFFYDGSHCLAIVGYLKAQVGVSIPVLRGAVVRCDTDTDVDSRK
jgi:hypothetical protein